MEKTVTVKDIMIPLEQYSTVREDATLSDAVKALKESQKLHDRNHDAHRAILVVTKKDGHVIGKISQMDVIRSLEPSYGAIIAGQPQVGRVGFSNRFLKLLADDYKLWKEPLADICSKAKTLPVTRIMYKPTSESEFVHENAAIDEAIHQLVMGHHKSLLVIRRGRITGILRLTDVFSSVAEMLA
ncbi:MAG: CBS domain-containing protein [Deltaproteobacteria bacterium]|nr:CBS domain-containing protein [Deltaproteobacteria bacterium]